MKRAIYVGKLLECGLEFLSYGMTGIIEVKSMAMGHICFVPDMPHFIGWSVPIRAIYIPSEHQTRHCPKP